MANQDSLYLFQDKSPDSLLLSQLYDPDQHGTDPANSGKIIPSPGSVVTDETTDIPYYVTKVDPVTFKSTLRALRVVVTDEDGNVPKILSYGNDRFCLYYDDRVRPTQLNIDGKLILFGSNNVEYQLVRNKADGTQETISLYLDSDEQYKGSRIPMMDVPGLPGAKQCTNCHTLLPIKNGDVVTLLVFDNAGRQTIELTLFTMRSIILNDLAADSNPIVGFDLRSLQTRGDEFYIYEKQDPSHLGLTPVITYADGSQEVVPIDQVNCWLYGLEDFIPSYPGYKQRLLVKLYLSEDQISPIAQNDSKYRFLAVEKWLTVVSNKSTYGVKISVVPVWDQPSRSYKLRFFAYSDRRDHVYDVTPLTTIEKPVRGDVFDVLQELIYTVDLSSVLGAEDTVTYRQATWLKFRPHTEFQRYQIQDSQNDAKVYGVEAPPQFRRPTIRYDSNLQQYYIPTSLFLNKAAFLESFYYLARPPFNANVELEPPVPTHFTIRAIDNCTTLISSPIEVEQYAQAWNILRQGDPAQLVDGVVLVEFLRLVGDTYQILYGVPVDVFQSRYGYNT